MHIPGQISAFNYTGGKYSILPWLLPNLPETKVYADVFGGSGVVLLNRRPSEIEIYNDINGAVVNFFRVLREYPDELIRQLQLTPYSRFEYDAAWDIDGDDNIEFARKTFVRMRQSFLSSGGQSKKKGWAFTNKSGRLDISEPVSKWLGQIQMLPQIVSRLRSVQIECSDFERVIENSDGLDSLLYCDPPYDFQFRSDGRNLYKHDFTKKDHKRLSEILLSCRGKVAISGYNSEMMMDYYGHWNVVIGPERRVNRSDKFGIRECLFCNYDPQAHQMKLF
jgi:DNA adenine methylase